jgi:hypothetical protein
LKTPNLWRKRNNFHPHANRESPKTSPERQKHAILGGKEIVRGRLKFKGSFPGEISPFQAQASLNRPESCPDSGQSGKTNGQVLFRETESSFCEM